MDKFHQLRRTSVALKPERYRAANAVDDDVGRRLAGFGTLLQPPSRHVGHADARRTAWSRQRQRHLVLIVKPRIQRRSFAIDVYRRRLTALARQRSDDAVERDGDARSGPADELRQRHTDDAGRPHERYTDPAGTRKPVGR